MRELPDTDRSFGYGETSWEAGYSSATSQGKVFHKDIIRQANTVPILNVFKHYGLRLSEYNHKITCPFKSHKGGRERTPSFIYYPDTNSYHCFGCNNGRSVCDFVAEMDGTDPTKAAFKILKLFQDSVGEEDAMDVDDASKRLEIMMDFSVAVRDFRDTHFSTKDQSFIEGVCSVYDDLYNKYNSKTRRLDNEALRRIVGQLKEKIVIYTCLK